MNRLLAFVLVIVGNFLASMTLPWWNLIIVSFIVVAICRLKSKASWSIPALGIMLLWLVQMVLLDQKTGFRSSQRIADIFDAPGFVSYVIPILTAGILAALSGYLAYLIFHREDRLVQQETEESMTIDEYKENTPGLEDKGII